MPQGVDVPALTGLGDAELAGIVQSLAEADVEHLILAVSRSSSPEVQSFAREAIVSRRGEATQDLALLDELGIVPSVGPVSDELLREGRDDRASLQALPGAAFDRAFIDHHVALDVRSVAWLDAIAANVESPRLKALVQSDRTSVAGHMREAQHVQQSTWSGR
jgi:putative membrane protein